MRTASPDLVTRTAWRQSDPAAHPEDAVMGVGIVVQSRLLVESDRHAVCPNTKFSFVGYTPNGFQMRVCWFTHATVSDYFPEPGMRAAAGRPA